MKQVGFDNIELKGGLVSGFMLLDGSRLDRELMLSVWVIIVMFFLTIRCICDLWLSICDTWLLLVMLGPLWSLVFLAETPQGGCFGFGLTPV